MRRTKEFIKKIAVLSLAACLCMPTGIVKAEEIDEANTEVEIGIETEEQEHQEDTYEEDDSLIEDVGEENDSLIEDVEENDDSINEDVDEGEEDEELLVGDGDDVIDNLESNVSYIGWDSESKNYTDEICESAIVIQEDSYSLGTESEESWYVVKGNIEISERIAINGNVNIILSDGCNMTAKKGISVCGENCLMIYSQSTGDDMGILTSNGNIGGDRSEVFCFQDSITVKFLLKNYNPCGKIVINGGKITASSGIGSGIGSAGFYYWGDNVSFKSIYIYDYIDSEQGEIMINGGIVKATGEVGIGSASNDTIKSIVINGGDVEASGGIGVCFGGGVKEIIINGGKVNAYGNEYAEAGIGINSRGKIVINGGEITATGAYGAAGISANASFESGATYSGDIVINGGKVTAVGGEGGAGIGGNHNILGRTYTNLPKNYKVPICDSITINNGEVIAKGGVGGAGIGGGSEGCAREIVINDGKVVAVAGSEGAGIGGGYKGTASIDINGGNIDIKNVGLFRYSGAGIGGGYGRKNSKITILGGVINISEFDPNSTAKQIGSGADPRTQDSAGEIIIKNCIINDEEYYDNGKTYYRVYFNSNGGTISKGSYDPEETSMWERRYKKGEIVSCIEVTKKGYGFDGWYKDESFTNKYDFSQPINEDLALYAKWNTLIHYSKKEPTCESTGNIEYWFCKENNKYYSDENGLNEINKEMIIKGAKGHKWGEWIVTKAPTETETGVRKRTCSNCYKTETEIISSHTISTSGIYCASNYPSIQAGINIKKSDKSDSVEYRWVACNNNEPDKWFEVSPWKKDNNWMNWTPDKSGGYVFVCYARVVGNEDTTQIQATFGTEYRKAIKGICQMPYTGEGGGYLIGIESYDNPNHSYKYEMLILDCNLYVQGKDAWVYDTGKCGAPENCLWTIWQPQYGYYWTLFRIYDQNDNLIDEACYGFENVN